MAGVQPQTAWIFRKMKATPLIGQKGQKYGLIKAQNLFQADDEDNDVNSLIRKEEFYKQKQTKVNFK